jgi:hypothetical protein
MIISLVNSNGSRFEKSARPASRLGKKADENETHPLHRVGWEESRCFLTHTPAPVDNNPWH